MRVEGTRSFAAPRAVVWEVLNNPAKMADLMPGVESFEVEDDEHWSAKVKVPLGLGGLRMSIRFEKTEERELEFARLHAKGTGVGALMDMNTGFHLSEEGEGTAMRWEADVKIAGPVGSMGQRVLQPIVNQQVKNVLDALERQLTQAAAGVAAGEAGGTQTPAQGSDAGGSAGTPEPTTDASPSTDPELKDYGPPADGVADPEGSSGGREGISPLAEEGYTDDPHGPTQTA
jgi:carbon monoxide dehydrogenase subunit G